MNGYAIIKSTEGFKKVPHSSDDSTGNVPMTTKDGERVWKWTPNEVTADKLIARQEGWRNRQINRGADAPPTPATKGKGK